MPRRNTLVNTKTCPELARQTHCATSGHSLWRRPWQRFRSTQYWWLCKCWQCQRSWEKTMMPWMVAMFSRRKINLSPSLILLIAVSSGKVQNVSDVFKYKYVTQQSALIQSSGLIRQANKINTCWCFVDYCKICWHVCVISESNGYVKNGGFLRLVICRYSDYVDQDSTVYNYRFNNG